MILSIILKNYWEKCSEEDRDVLQQISKEYEYTSRMNQLSQMRKQTIEVYEEAKAIHEDAKAEEAWSLYEKVTALQRIFEKIAHTDEELTTEEKIVLASFFDLDYSNDKDVKELENLIKQHKEFDNRTR